MKRNHLNLFFPQWQGSGISKDLYYSALKVRDAYLPDSRCEEVGICENDNMTVEKGIYAYKEVFEQLLSAVSVLRRRTPDTIFTDRKSTRLNSSH